MPLLLAIVGLALNALGVLFLVTAAALPYWVYFKEHFHLADSGNPGDAREVELIYHYGFWSYCNEVTTTTSSLRTCAAAETSSGSKC